MVVLKEAVASKQCQLLSSLFPRDTSRPPTDRSFNATGGTLPCGKTLSGLFLSGCTRSWS